MNTKVINDAASLQRLGMLLESMEGRRSHLERVAQAHRDAGSVHDAYDAQQAANHAAWVAYRVRCYMATMSAEESAEDKQADPIGVAISEAMEQQEPPRQLVPFVSWLRALIGHLLPWVTAETWQTCGALMLMDRDRQRGAL